MIPEPERDLYLKIANFIQWVIYHPLFLGNSDSEDIPKELLIDEVTVELGKFIMMGEKNYLSDPSPVRMYGNRRIEILKEDIKKIAIDIFQNLQELIKIKDEINSIAIPAAYRGINIILVQHIKQWREVFCCEPNEYLSSRLKEYFKDKNLVFSSKNITKWEYKDEI